MTGVEFVQKVIANRYGVWVSEEEIKQAWPKKGGRYLPATAGEIYQRLKRR